KTLVAPTKAAMGFPSIPGLPDWAPNGLVQPILHYDFGPNFNHVDESGIVEKNPPDVLFPLKTVVPKVNADGNELGGVPVVLLDAPLGTYLGWNITATGFPKDQICNYVGGMLPFAATAAERRAVDDPRPSLEERYGSHDGYVEKVRAAAARALEQKFLLPEDAQALIDAARASAVLR